jgi:cell division ATPase FtsA
MMKFNFFSPVKKPSNVDRGKYENFLTLDIGTEAVKAIIFKRLIGVEKENQRVVVLGKSIEYYNKSNVFDAFEFEENTIKKTIEEVLREVHQNLLQTLKRETKKQNLNISLKSFPVLIGLPPNILKEKIDVHSYERKEPRSLISKKEESLIYQAISKEIKEKVGDDFQKEFGILPTDVQLLDFKIIEIKIDGYEVFRLEGYRGKNLDFRIFTIFVPKKYLENIGKIAKELKLKIYKILDKNQNLSL